MSGGARTSSNGRHALLRSLRTILWQRTFFGCSSSPMKMLANTAPARKNWVGRQFAGPQATVVPSGMWNSTANLETRSLNLALNILFDAMGQKFLLATVAAIEATT